MFDKKILSNKFDISWTTSFLIVCLFLNFKKNDHFYICNISVRAATPVLKQSRYRNRAITFTPSTFMTSDRIRRTRCRNPEPISPSTDRPKDFYSSQSPLTNRRPESKAGTGWSAAYIRTHISRNESCYKT